MTLARRLFAEGLGALLLTAAVIGSGIMAERLTQDTAIALLANTAATVAALAILIALFAPVSGAHFNPAVSLAFALRGRLSWREAAAYAAAQVIGCYAGAMLAHLIFELPLLTLSAHERAGFAQRLSEFVATAGLVFVIFGIRREEAAPWMVAGWIGAAYWFTASPSFANPRNHDCPLPFRYVRRNTPARCALVHCRATNRRSRGNFCSEPAWDDAKTPTSERFSYWVAWELAINQVP